MDHNGNKEHGLATNSVETSLIDEPTQSMERIEAPEVKLLGTDLDDELMEEGPRATVVNSSRPSARGQSNTSSFDEFKVSAGEASNSGIPLKRLPTNDNQGLVSMPSADYDMSTGTVTRDSQPYPAIQDDDPNQTSLASYSQGSDFQISNVLDRSVRHLLLHPSPQRQPSEFWDPSVALSGLSLLPSSLSPTQQAAANPTNAYDMFSPFNRLPYEIRLAIWKLSLDMSPRNVKVHYDQVVGKFNNLTRAPANLHVCQESRNLALNIWKPEFETPGHPAGVPLNMETDTVRLNWEPFHLGILTPLTLPKIRFLELRASDLSRRDVARTATVLIGLTSVETITILSHSLQPMIPFPTVTFAYLGRLHLLGSRDPTARYQESYILYYMLNAYFYAHRFANPGLPIPALMFAVAR